MANIHSRYPEGPRGGNATEFSGKSQEGATADEEFQRERPGGAGGGGA